MEYERKGVSIAWQIDNAKYMRKREMELYSPVIAADVMEGTKWKLGLHRMSETKVWLTIEREVEDNGPEKFGLHYEFSVNEPHDTSAIRKRMHTSTFLKGQRCPEVAVNYRKIDKCLSPDTIRIWCKLWQQQGSISKSGHFFAQTRMKTESCTFVGVVECFSDFCIYNFQKLFIATSSTNEKLIRVKLQLFRPIPVTENTVEGLKLEIAPMQYQNDRLLNFKLFILDSSGDKADIGQLEQELALEDQNELKLPDVSKGYLLENAGRYLPNDTLSLHCELTFCSEVEYENVEGSEYKTDSVADTDLTEFSNSVTAEVGKPCDAKLQTPTETFSAHIAILSEKSPIFEAMFNTEMEESIKKCVRIDDVDAATVKRMLVFLYSSTLEELEWKDAMKLYFAADKYQILPLKQKTAALLTLSLDLSNCIVLLLLADMHQDDLLKKCVRSFITEYGREVLYGDQWRDLEKNLPQLAIETLRDVFLESISRPSIGQSGYVPRAPRSKGAPSFLPDHDDGYNYLTTDLFR